MRNRERRRLVTRLARALPSGVPIEARPDGTFRIGDTDPIVAVTHKDGSWLVSDPGRPTADYCPTTNRLPALVRRLWRDRARSRED